MVELVYTIALEAIAAMHESSNLSTSIDNNNMLLKHIGRYAKWMKQAVFDIPHA